MPHKRVLVTNEYSNSLSSKGSHRVLPKAFNRSMRLLILNGKIVWEFRPGIIY